MPDEQQQPTTPTAWEQMVELEIRAAFYRRGDLDDTAFAATAESAREVMRLLRTNLKLTPVLAAVLTEAALQDAEGNRFGTVDGDTKDIVAVAALSLRWCAQRAAVITVVEACEPGREVLRILLANPTIAVVVPSVLIETARQDTRNRPRLPERHGPIAARVSSTALSLLECAWRAADDAAGSPR